MRSEIPQDGGNAIGISIDFDPETLEPVMVLGIQQNGEMTLCTLNWSYANQLLSGITMGMAHLNRLMLRVAGMDEDERKSFIEHQRAVWASDQN